MRTCFLHIGPHKTGSSTLQSCLFRNSKLLATHGIYVPEMKAVKRQGNHHRLAVEINQNRTTVYREELSSELRSAGFPERIVMSSEDLSTRIREPEVRDRIENVFRPLGYQVTTIAYVRPQFDIANPYFTERAKKLIRIITFEGFFADFLKEPIFDLQYKFGGLVADRRFQKIFVPFSSELLRKGLCQHFLATLGLGEVAIANSYIPSRRNESPGPRTIAALLEISKKIRNLDTVPPARKLVDLASSLRRMANTMGWNDLKFDGLTGAQRRLIIDHFAASNEAFANSVWNTSWQGIFAGDEAKALQKERSVFDIATASPEEREEFEQFCAFGLQLAASSPDKATKASRIPGGKRRGRPLPSTSATVTSAVKSVSSSRKTD